MFYDVAVHYRDDRGFGPSIATVKVWYDGAVVHEMTDTFEPGEFRPITSIWGGTGTVVSTQ